MKVLVAVGSPTGEEIRRLMRERLGSDRGIEIVSATAERDVTNLGLDFSGERAIDEGNILVLVPRPGSIFTGADPALKLVAPVPKEEVRPVAVDIDNLQQPNRFHERLNQPPRSPKGQDGGGNRSRQSGTGQRSFR